LATRLPDRKDAAGIWWQIQPLLKVPGTTLCSKGRRVAPLGGRPTPKPRFCRRQFRPPNCVCGDLKLRRPGNLCFSRKNAIFGTLPASDRHDLGGLNFWPKNATASPGPGSTERLHRHRIAAAPDREGHSQHAAAAYQSFPPAHPSRSGHADTMQARHTLSLCLRRTCGATVL
jgi:hypothetical protein